jgi:hypothetical protein
VLEESGRGLRGQLDAADELAKGRCDGRALCLLQAPAPRCPTLITALHCARRYEELKDSLVAQHAASEQRQAAEQEVRMLHLRQEIGGTVTRAREADQQVRLVTHLEGARLPAVRLTSVTRRHLAHRRRLGLSGTRRRWSGFTSPRLNAPQSRSVLLTPSVLFFRIPPTLCVDKSLPGRRKLTTPSPRGTACPVRQPTRHTARHAANLPPAASHVRAAGRRAHAGCGTAPGAAQTVGAWQLGHARISVSIWRVFADEGTAAGGCRGEAC